MRHKLRLLLVVVISVLLIACHREAPAKIKQLAEQSRANMVYVEGGEYVMGPSNPDWQSGNTTPPHKVILSSFYMSKDNVSYGEYDIYTQATGKHYIEDDISRQYHDYSENAVHPVDNITWYQADDYCQWLARETGLNYSLPTEAHWEYAARNRGKEGWAFATDNGKQELGVNFPDEKQYTYQKGSTGDYYVPLPVGSIPCNPLGLCGMNGEVVQWMKDWYDPTYYSHSPIKDPQGPASGKLKSARDGGSESSPSFDNVYARGVGVAPNEKMAGFRCVINSSIPPDQLAVYAQGPHQSQ